MPPRAREARKESKEEKRVGDLPLWDEVAVRRYPIRRAGLLLLFDSIFRASGEDTELRKVWLAWEDGGRDKERHYHTAAVLRLNGCTRRISHTGHRASGGWKWVWGVGVVGGVETSEL